MRIAPRSVDAGPFTVSRMRAKLATSARLPVPRAGQSPRTVDVALRALSRSANNGRLWLGLAAIGVLAARGRSRQAAIRGTGSLAATSLVVHAAAKPLFGRQRPEFELVPLVRRPARRPWTKSFPSGHAASAAAFTCGVALESPVVGLTLAPVAAAVAYSRVHVGVHYVSDVLAGAALGAGVAIALRRWWPVPAKPPATIRPRTATALPRGQGLLVFVNPAAGNGSGDAASIGDLLSEAEIIELAPDLDVDAELGRRAGRIRAIGVVGGDGTLSSLTGIALRHRLPVALFPAGTMNHFARDIGLRSFEDSAHAVEAGHAVAVDVGLAGDIPFVNTASLGAYPQMVRRRDELSALLGKWPAMVVATAETLHRQRPLRLTIDGVDVELWSLFVGNGRYSVRGPFPPPRSRLDDGLLDVQYLRVGPLSRIKAVLAALGGIGDYPGYQRWLTTSVRVTSPDGTATIARDGEPGEARKTFEFGKLDRKLLIYRPRDTSGPAA